MTGKTLQRGHRKQWLNELNEWLSLGLPKLVTLHD